MGVGFMAECHVVSRVRHGRSDHRGAGGPTHFGTLIRKALTERGQAYEQQLTFRLTPEGIVYDLTDLTMVARWSCVTDLYQTRKYWVFLVQSSAIVLPRRLFTAREDELNFIARAVSQMPAAAQERSPDATKFLRT